MKKLITTIALTLFGLFANSQVLTQLSSPFCSYTSTSTTEFIWADSIGTPSTQNNYRYKFMLVDGVNTYTWQTGNQWPIMQFYQVSGYSFATTYTTSVAWSSDFGATFSAYGSTCTLTSPTPTTQLNSTSCGSSPATYTTAIVAVAVPLTTQYEYKLYNTALSYTQSVVKTNNNFNLSQISNWLANTTYSVSVRIFINSAWQIWGPDCNITTPSYPTTMLNTSSCGSSPATYTTLLVANIITNATQYEYKLYNTSLSYTQSLVKTNNNFNLSQISNWAANTTYTVNVRVYYNSVWGNFGSDCNITTPSYPTTMLNTASCGSSPATFTTVLVANTITGATQYEYKLTNSALSYTQSLLKSNNNFTLKQVSTLQVLQLNTTYTVNIKVLYNGVWGIYGNSCNVTTPGSYVVLIKNNYSQNNSTARTISGSATELTVFEAMSYPNPFSGSATIRINTSNTAEQISINVFDINGKVLEAHSINPKDIADFTVGDQFITGIYNIVVVQGSNIKNIKLIKN